MQKKITLADGITVQIRPPVTADTQCGYEAVIASLAELSPWMPWCRDGYTEQAAAEWVELSLQSRENRTAFHFMIFDESEQQCLGTCGFNYVNHEYRSAFLGYWVRTGHTGQGIATAVARSVAEYGFEELGLVRIEILIALENEKSQRVAEKLGAVREGIKRNGMIERNQPRDAARFSLVPGDL